MTTITIPSETPVQFVIRGGGDIQHALAQADRHSLLADVLSEELRRLGGELPQDRQADIRACIYRYRDGSRRWVELVADFRGRG
jgi:hypothetical protein